MLTICHSYFVCCNVSVVAALLFVSYNGQSVRGFGVFFGQSRRNNDFVLRKI